MQSIQSIPYSGASHFEYTLLDGDFAINNANWQWLSCSRFFHQFGRCYSPVAFGKKTDPTGEYIRKWLPQLKNMPAKYIYEPWTAPISVQRSSGCIIGTDYPEPICDHSVVSKENMGRLKAAYDQQKAGVALTMPKPTTGSVPGYKTSSTPATSSSSSSSSSSAEDTPSVAAFFPPSKKPRVV